jgi:hypothetical protein
MLYTSSYASLTKWIVWVKNELNRFVHGSITERIVIGIGDYMKTLIVILSLLGFGESLEAETNTIVFLLSERAFPSNFDSFALPLDRSEDIAYARQIIANPTDSDLHKLVSVRVAAGGDGINRNYIAAGAPPWSWHVSQFLGFSDFTVNSTAPVILELDINRHIQLYGDIYGFPGYIITAELGPILTLVTRDQGGLISFDWNSLRQSLYLYTLEGTDSLDPPQWKPVVGGVWPAQTNHFVLVKQPDQPHFFRIKAELPKLNY